MVCEQHDLRARCHVSEDAKSCFGSFVIELHQYVIDDEWQRLVGRAGRLNGRET